MMASPSAIRPTTWAVNTGVPTGTLEESETGAAFCLPGGAAAADAELGVAAGLIEGKRLDALPAPMSKLASLFRFGMGPSGSTDRCAVLGEEVGEAVAEVTATASAAAGDVHFAVVATLAVAVSFTELTDLAPDATAIWACRVAGVFTVTEPTVHEAVPSPLAQPLLNSGF
jgi:hypothetical protein